MDKSIEKIYQENAALIKEIEDAEQREREKFYQIEASYKSKLENLAKRKTELIIDNNKIANKKYVFSFEDVISEIKRLARLNGYSTPDVHVRISTTIWSRRHLSVKKCREWLENPDNEYYLDHSRISIVVRCSEEDKDKPNFCFDYSIPLDFDMKLCDGTILEDNLTSQLCYDDIQGEYYIELLMPNRAKNNLPIVVDTTRFEQFNMYKNKFVLEALQNLQARNNSYKNHNSNFNL